MTTHIETKTTRTRKGKARQYRIYLIIAAILVGSAIFLVPQLSGKDDATDAAPADQLRVLTVPTITLEEDAYYLRKRYYLGQVETQRSSQLGFEVPGMIKTIRVREGEYVAAGSLLAELDTQRLNAAKQEAEAQLIEALAANQLAEATLKRTQHAHKLKAVSIQKLDEAVSNLERQKARVARVKAQVNRINVDLAKSKIYAPYSGTIAVRRSDEGTVIGAGQTVLELVETAKTEIRIGFDRSVSADLVKGSRVQAVVRNTPLTLRIDRILPGRERTTRVVEVIAVPESSAVELREDDLVEVSVRQQIDTPGYWMPVSALTENARGLWSCLVAIPLETTGSTAPATHRLVRRDLKVLALEEERIFVSGQLNDGEQLVVNGIHRVVPNQRVNIQTLATDQNRGAAPLDT